ncbi:MAG: hypothetical protein M3431_10160 [Actinomycetota bacterium]|nr:hypothetical protein [Actinomycetota bacterium]
MSHPLAAVLHRAANGEFPATDGATDVLPPDDDGTVGVVSFTGHAYVLADVDPGDCASRLGGGGGFGGALAPHLQQWLAGTERSIGSLDVVLAAPAGRRDGASLPRRDDQLDHGRVQRALRHRRDVQARGDDNGLVIIGRGLVGRWELSVELFDPDGTAPGSGRRLIDAGLGLIPDGEWCWAQVAAGNSRSLRAFLAVGFVPVCSEVLISQTEHDQR